MSFIEFTYTDEAGEEIPARLPAEWEICSTCRGNGTHVNPAIDGNGISPEQFAEDPDFAESYFAGHYDVRCADCNGTGKVLVPVRPADDSDRSAELVAYDEKLADDAAYERMCEMERRMGA